jgi:hypothetical protein
MKRIDGRVVAGLVLIGFGALFFLQTVGLIPLELPDRGRSCSEGPG